VWSEIEYQFEAEPIAYRFLNTVKSWGQAELKAEYGKDSYSVKITYKVDILTFDDTLSRLDELAFQFGGKAD